ncbi:MAG: hypothetical protein AB8B87_14140 [Granulosicoccus sp.]
MTAYEKMPKWPFYSTDNQSSHTDLDLNQSLSIILDDDDLRDELIIKFRDPNVKPVQAFASFFHPDDDERSRPYSYVPPGKHRKNTWLVAGYDEVRKILENKGNYFSNVSYAELGDRSFVLALDPYNTTENPDAHQLYSRQRKYMNDLVRKPAGLQLQKLADESVRHAVVSGLTHNQFDLAQLAEQAAVRFCGLWFGFASTDHDLIQKTATTSYRALVYLIMGKHFCNEPTAVPQARAAMAQLTERAYTLIAEYRKVAWEPREVRGNLKNRISRTKWPEGVTPLDEWGLSDIGQPLLQRMALESEDFTIAELASMTTGLIAGAIGNIQASICTSIQQIFADQENHYKRPGQSFRNKQEDQQDPLAIAIAKAEKYHKSETDDQLHQLVGQLLMNYPPVAYLPRRAAKDVTLGGQEIKQGEEIILWLTAASRLKRLRYTDGNYDLPFGAPDLQISKTTDTSNKAQTHPCLGKSAAHSLATAMVATVLRLPSVAEVIDPFTGKPEGMTRRWGFSCQSYPFTHKRAMRLAQQPLNVVMRVKSPTDFHSSALRHIIHVGAPRVEKVLNESGHVHFAWFQLLDQGRYLALHTVYDGDFHAYIQDFALKVDDLFDLLFEHVEGAPKLPVAENPGSFVDVIRANNAPAVNGFFYSAMPNIEASDVARHVEREA